jgi:hypothetical protein
MVPKPRAHVCAKMGERGFRGRKVRLMSGLCPVQGPAVVEASDVG